MKTDPECETPVLYEAIQDRGTPERERADLKSEQCRFTSSTGKNGSRLNEEDMTSMCGRNVSSQVIDTMSEEDEATPDGNMSLDGLR